VSIITVATLNLFHNIGRWDERLFPSDHLGVTAKLDVG
jgi:hypothetical protein